MATVFITLPFNYYNLDVYYSNVVKQVSGVERESVGYKVGKDSFSFVNYEDVQSYYLELVIIKHTMLAPKKTYKTNLPIKSNSDFELIMNLAGIKLEKIIR